jgi:hypothetical protein
MTKSFIFVGPALFGGARQETVEFPWEQLDSAKPLIYVSMGTLYYQVFFLQFIYVNLNRFIIRIQNFSKRVLKRSKIRNTK